MQFSSDRGDMARGVVSMSESKEKSARAVARGVVSMSEYLRRKGRGRHRVALGPDSATEVGMAVFYELMEPVKWLDVIKAIEVFLCFDGTRQWIVFCDLCPIRYL